MQNLAIMKKQLHVYMFVLTSLAFPLKGIAQSDTAKVGGGLMLDKVDVAYGKQLPNQVTSAVSYISGEEISKSSISNLGNTLFGKLPGLFVTQGGGEPGNNSPELRVRGANAAPLVIIDGFERELTFLAPEEIATVALLKDASAVALYGMKGANGVLLINTKRGAVEKERISVSIQSGLQTMSKTMDVLDSKSYMTLYNQAAQNDGLPSRYSQQEILSAGSSPRFPDVNWKDEVLKNFSNVSKANVGAQGGTNFIQYYVNLGFLYNDGMYKPENPDMDSNANLMRLNIRSNIDMNITKNTVFSMDLAGIMNRSKNPAYSVGEIWNAIFTLPPNAFNVLNPDGSYGGSPLLLNNPVAMLESSGRNSSIDQFLNAGFQLKQKMDFITKGLAARIGYVIDNGGNNSEGNWRYFQARQIAPGAGDDYDYYTYRDPSSYNNWSSSRSSRSTIFNADINYEMPKTNGHELTAMVRYQGDQFYLSNSDLFPYKTENLGGRIHYAYQGTYLLELTGSYYGSDHFADGKRFGFFPALSAGWVFSNAGFLKDNELVSYGKVRASYGESGLNRFVNGRYPFYQFYVGGGGFPLGKGWNWTSGIKPGMLANPDFAWETSTKLNVGLDLELLDHFSLAFDYYVNKRHDVLYVDYNHPSVAGANLPLENIGKLTNRGFDFKLGYAQERAGFKWYSDLVFSYFNNTIDEMGESLNTGALSNLNKTGNSVSAVYGYQVDGYFQSNVDIQSSPVHTFGSPRVGDLKYKDLNNDNVIDTRDMTKIGDHVGNIDLGLKLGFSYKRFDFEALLQGQFNRDIVLQGNKLAQPFLSGNAITEIALEDGFPALSLTNTNNYQSSSYWIRNGDFVKLRNVEIGYTLPINTIGRLGKTDLRLFLRGDNVFAISDWTYSDPEFAGIGYPPMKTYLIGVNVNF